MSIFPKWAAVLTVKSKIKMAKMDFKNVQELLSSTLIAGEVESFFPDASDIRTESFQFCDGLLEATSMASDNKCGVVCFLAQEIDSQLRQAIKAIKTTNPKITITLVVPMYQEPLAIELTNKYNGMVGADDYIVCPTNREELTAMLKKSAGLDKKQEQDIDSNAFEQLAKLATEDDLTGLKNRRYVREFLRQMIERAPRDNMRVTLLMFDIDNFKHYNDVYGHGAGDEILKEAAALMKRCCRKHDVVGRIGGDEFAVVFWDNPADTSDNRRKAQMEHPREIYFIADRFRRELSAAQFPALGAEGKGVLTISGGIAGYPQEGMDVDELFEGADRGLLEAKRLGKNRIYLVGEPEAQ
jgi:two-component system cell cycle response regulator